mgnify:CR=1 FL=1
MLADKAKQQEELIHEYEEQNGRNRDIDSEMDLLRLQVDSMMNELKVGRYHGL